MGALPFLEKVRETIRRHKMLARGARAGVAVSGGADSVCLLHVLHTLAPEEGWRLEVLHLDHSLRGAESDADAQFVLDLAGHLQLPCHVEKTDASALARARRDNLEQAARQARLDFFRRMIQTLRLDKVATGHTLSDQAETVLFRAARGTGLEGLSGILPVTASALIRPLIECSRSEVRQWLVDRGHRWREDSSNASLLLARNRLRLDVLPRLTAVNHRAEAALARLASLAREDNRALDAIARRLLSRFGVRHGRTWIIDLVPFQATSAALRRRILRRAISGAAGGTRRIELAHLDALLELAASSRGAGAVSLPSVSAQRSFHLLRIGPPPPRWPFPELSFNPPFAAGPISVELVSLAGEQDPWPPPASAGRPVSYWLDPAAVDGPLTLRNWRPGDSFQPRNSDHPQPLHSLFQSARIPSWERRNWPVLLCQGRIAWTRGFGPAAWACAVAQPRLVLLVQDSDPPALSLSHARP